MRDMTFIRTVTAAACGVLLCMGFFVGIVALMLRLIGYSFSVAWWISFPISLSTCAIIALALLVRPRNFTCVRTRQERCTLCGHLVSDWVDPDWAPGRVCRDCETKHTRLI